MTEVGIFEILHDYIFSGGISKGGTWGGKDCLAAISYDKHYTELVIWSIICTILYSKLNYPIYYAKIIELGTVVLHKHVRTMTSRIFDVIFGLLHFGIWFLVLYYKINLHSLINLFQPCHLALFIQGLGVTSNGPTGAIIGILSLPLVIGPMAAVLVHTIVYIYIFIYIYNCLHIHTYLCISMYVYIHVWIYINININTYLHNCIYIYAFIYIQVPALDGLDQPYEKQFFFIQHYLMLGTPFFLLLRNNSCALRLMSFRSILFSNWCILIVHFFIFAVRVTAIYCIYEYIYLYVSNCLL
jgi:hypothetical protein